MSSTTCRFHLRLSSFFLLFIIYHVISVSAIPFINTPQKQSLTSTTNTKTQSTSTSAITTTTATTTTTTTTTTRQSEDNTAEKLVANRRYFRKLSHPFGCPSSVFYSDELITTNLPPNVEANILFDDIKVNGKKCTFTGRDSRTILAPYPYVKSQIGNSAALTKAARDSIELAGLDLQTRSCGLHQDAEAMQYLFTTKFSDLYNFLVNQYFHTRDSKIEQHLEEEKSLEDESKYAWMVSMSQVKKDVGFRICVYRAGLSDSPTSETVPNDSDDSDSTNEEISTPVPTDEELPTPTPEVEDTSSQNEDAESSDESDTPSSNTPHFGQGSTFGQATNQSSGNMGVDATDIASSSCFPASAIVYTSINNGDQWTSKRLGDVSIGDVVMTGNGAKRSSIFGFTHEDKSSWTWFVRIGTDQNKTLEITDGHYIHTWPKGELKTARDIGVGDSLFGIKSWAWSSSTKQEGEWGRERIISRDRVWRQGIMNAQTMDGDIVVGGLLVSTYTERVQSETAHALLAPLRALYRWFGLAMCMPQGLQSRPSFTFKS